MITVLVATIRRVDSVRTFLVYDNSYKGVKQALPENLEYDHKLENGEKVLVIPKADNASYAWVLMSPFEIDYLQLFSSDELNYVSGDVVFYGQEKTPCVNKDELLQAIKIMAGIPEVMYEDILNRARVLRAQIEMEKKTPEQPKNRGDVKIGYITLT